MPPWCSTTAREVAALFRIADRHASSPQLRSRQVHPDMLASHEAVRLVAFLLSGATTIQDGEAEVDQADLVAALTLLPRVRAEFDALEADVLKMARGRSMTWQEIAFGLGLGSPQAARQRYERLTERAVPDHITGL
ncbi:DNA-binding protein [Sinosporangium siamense]|uniref:DNA-binding protein n=1 Tax=Sinosporangium siamense TaxID=1367973 RepID=A0A919V6A2_9ACTN|nr:DNA-binding protein [Sinosporangium siamense]GII92283.1 hypothetical protein Ssi02_25140 [Sinosporangium siamense]